MINGMTFVQGLNKPDFDIIIVNFELVSDAWGNKTRENNLECKDK